MAGKRSGGRKGKKKSGAKWTSLRHNGILFPPAYEAQGRSIKVRGREVKLSPLQEEMAYQWAKKKDMPLAQDPEYQQKFRENFTMDFVAALGPDFKGVGYSDIDFTAMYRVVDREKDARERQTKEDRKDLAAKRKKVREEFKGRYGTAYVDGKPVDVGNYMVEPAGIFMGRGLHPLRGRWKRRITHADVTLNLGRGEEVPPGDWKEVVHRTEATWLASWTDVMTENRDTDKNTKYVWLADTAGLKQEKDKEKYEKAVRLAKGIDKIKDRMVRDMKGGDPEKSKIATVCYLIYRTAMRVGDEKDADEADTVGATTLRKEHVRITEKGIEFDFLGKDSVRWQETVPAEGHDVQFRDNMERLIRDKKPSDEIFDGIRSSKVNKYYSGIVKGMSAKVFRTYSATTVVLDYLKGLKGVKKRSDNEKMYHAKMANLEAAIKCNHKRTIPKTFEKSLEKKRETLKKAKKAVTKTDKQKERKKIRIEKIKLQIDLSEKTRDYNLGTSLRNYIDPRVVKAWTTEMGVDWTKMYTKALQKKFLWVQSENVSWKSVSGR